MSSVVWLKIFSSLHPRQAKFPFKEQIYEGELPRGTQKVRANYEE